MLTTLQIDREGAVLRVRLRDVKIPVLCTSLKKKGEKFQDSLIYCGCDGAWFLNVILQTKGEKKKGDLRHDEQ